MNLFEYTHWQMQLEDSCRLASTNLLSYPASYSRLAWQKQQTKWSCSTCSICGYMFTRKRNFVNGTGKRTFWRSYVAPVVSYLMFSTSCCHKMAVEEETLPAFLSCLVRARVSQNSTSTLTGPVSFDFETWTLNALPQKRTNETNR